MDIKELNLEQLQEWLLAAKAGKFYAKEIFGWIYGKKALSFETMSNLPRPLRERLAKEFYISGLILKKIEKSSDGVEKFLFELKDKNLIESVSIPARGRITGCISSQAGCKYACGFCASGLKGFKRNLTKGEILDQILLLRQKNLDLTHIVFMGTGEPFDNYENVISAIRVINSKTAFNIGARRITVSTCGLLPGIERLSKEELQIELSVSLHAADDKKRDLLMPVNKKYPLGELIKACRDYTEKTNRQITFEYILIKDFNSSIEEARKLGQLLKKVRLAKVNLIPANPVAELNIFPPSKNEVALFKENLIKERINVTLRKERGQDISAACGQLRFKYEKT